MTEDDDALAEIDERIAENDREGTPDAQWRAAYAVYDKAELIERLYGDEAALPLYFDVARRLDGRSEPGARSLLISALNAGAVVHHLHDRDVQSRAAAEALVTGHFDDAPLDAAEPVANATLLLSRFLDREGERERALTLLDRLIDRYGQPGVSGGRRTSAIANMRAAWYLGDSGRFEEAVVRHDRALESLGWPVEAGLRWVVVEALVGKAYAASELDRVADRDALCALILERFGGDEDPVVRERVEWARMVLESYSTRGRRRSRTRRRSG